MTRKYLLSFLMFITFLFVSTCVFATNNLSNELQNSWDKTRNTLDSAGNIVTGTVGTITNGATNAFNQMMNGNNNNSTNDTATAFTNMNTDTNFINPSPATNSDYTATRTATNNNNNNTGLSNLAMTWIILAITTVIIVSLIWYYGTQNNNETRVKDDEH